MLLFLVKNIKKKAVVGNPSYFKYCFTKILSEKNSTSSTV